MRFIFEGIQYTIDHIRSILKFEFIYMFKKNYIKHSFANNVEKSKGDKENSGLVGGGPLLLRAQNSFDF